MNTITIPSNEVNLSDLIDIGRALHGRCKEAHVSKEATRHNTIWFTDAIAAAYAAAFGPQYVETSMFSGSEATWRLGQYLGYDLNALFIPVDGKEMSVIDAVLYLTDMKMWSRGGIADYLRSYGL